MEDKEMTKYNVAGYVKLAKLWERTAEQATAYHRRYYEEKFRNNPQMDLVGVYIDITGQKHIRKRKQMVQLISDCITGKVNCIATQTRAYLAANNEEFFYLLHLLFELDHPVDIVTEDTDYLFDTIVDADRQRDTLKATSADYVKMNPKAYEIWHAEIMKAIEKTIRQVQE